MPKPAASKIEPVESQDKPQMGRPRSVDVDRRIKKESLVVVS